LLHRRIATALVDSAVSGGGGDGATANDAAIHCGAFGARLLFRFLTLALSFSLSLFFFVLLNFVLPFFLPYVIAFFVYISFYLF
jgi:hypothetical protein